MSTSKQKKVRLIPGSAKLTPPILQSNTAGMIFPLNLHVDPAFPGHVWFLKGMSTPFFFPFRHVWRTCMVPTPQKNHSPHFFSRRWTNCVLGNPACPFLGERVNNEVIHHPIFLSLPMSRLPQVPVLNGQFSYDQMESYGYKNGMLHDASSWFTRWAVFKIPLSFHWILVGL